MSRRVGRSAAALLCASAIWIPCLQFFYAQPIANFHSAKGLSPKARQLAARQLRLWTDPASRKRFQAVARRRSKEVESLGRVQHLELAFGDNPDVCKSSGFPCREKLLGVAIREGQKGHAEILIVYR